MRKLCNLWQLPASRCFATALAATLLATLDSSIAIGQPGGVVFVDDVQQQAQRATERASAMPNIPTGSLYAQRGRVPAPSVQARYPQPTVRSLSPAAEQPKKESGWSNGIKKTLSGLFGGSPNAPQRPTPTRTSSASTIPSRPLMFGPSPGNAGMAGTPQSSPTRATSPGPSEKPSLMDRMRLAGSGGAPQRPNAGQNSPRGILQWWGDNSTDQPVVARTGGPTSGDRIANVQPQLPRPQFTREPQHDSWASKLRLPAGNNTQSTPALNRPTAHKWQEDDMVAMVTDRPSMTPNSNRTRTASPRAERASNASGQLAEVVPPGPSTDRLSTPRSNAVAQVPTTQATPPEQHDSAAKQFAMTGPQEIINRHAGAQNPLPRNTATRADWKAPSAVNPATRPAERVASATQGSDRGVSMPENPVKQPEPVAVAPSTKSVELLTEANRLSTTAVNEEEYTTIIQLCRHVLAIDDSPVAVGYSHDLASWALNRRGEVKSDEGRTKEALLDFEDALRLDPKRWRAIHNRGVLAAHAGRFADAFDDFNRTIELNPQFAKAYSNRGALYVQAGKLDKASEDYRQAIALDPDLAVAHKGRGRVCHMLGQFDLALQHFDAATLLAPSDARIVNNRGDLLTDMGRYRGAMSDYQKAIELDPSLHVAFRNLAWLQATCPDKECRDANEAIANASRAMQLCSQPGDLEYDTLAAAQAAAGDFESAGAMMDKAIQCAVESDKPNYRWRKQLYERGQPYITEPANNIQQASYAK